ncbi:MAG: radical SAM protein, partial [Ignavibacteria bacterium]|nr:radical SAM protein [Ignavibacteria bacterium]
MYRQVGDKLIYENNVALRGMIIRHLVLPNDLVESEKVFEFIASELSTSVHISLMSQYFPTNKANQHILLNRKIRNSEYEKVISLVEKYKLTNGWIQELESSDFYIPHFNESR